MTIVAHYCWSPVDNSGIGDEIQIDIEGPEDELLTLRAAIMDAAEHGRTITLSVDAADTVVRETYTMSCGCEEKMVPWPDAEIVAMPTTIATVAPTIIYWSQLWGSHDGQTPGPLTSLGPGFRFDGILKALEVVN